MGSGTDQNYWNTHDEGVRVTIVRSQDQAPITTPVDLTNRTLPSTVLHFGKISKLDYTNGAFLTPTTTAYTCVQPAKELPYIIQSDQGQASLEEIKSYFTDELVVRYIAEITGVPYDTLINGNYKILLEPIAYITYQGVKMALTATEVALYDQALNGGLRAKFADLSHKNLPLAMFLETPDLGYPAWSGSTNSRVSNEDILSSLGLGIVRFTETPPPPPVESAADYEYRTNTEVITSVFLSTGRQITPNSPATVTFSLMGSTYTVSGIVIPEGDSQVVWCKWRTPSTPQTVTIQVISSQGVLSQARIQASIVDLDENPPPDPQATDRNDSFILPALPASSAKTSASWGVWSASWHPYWVWISNWVWFGIGNGGGYWVDYGYWKDNGWWDYHWTSYSASLSTQHTIKPSSKTPTASGSTMKSGYGVEIDTTTEVRSNAPSSHLTGAQTAVTMFPEFHYQTYWRLHERMTNGLTATFKLKPNMYSTYQSRSHFTPLWFPDGPYTPDTLIEDVWTPDGMLFLHVSGSVQISGNLYMDWRIAPQK
ncbi:MAG: hypothetical protein K0R57_2830 [Paenibacillaceae bacterium]|nr:hypothetical protein [Paenibacillaceae bacterium]